MGAIFSAIIFSVVGMCSLGAGLYIFDRLTPFQFWKEICEENNTALAIVVGFSVLGLSIIVAASIHS